ncbi:hypothetical protein HYALB_00007828 [Hymenoscyphus albidus]|uniref:C2H2-type domain-containing protein n=1 Tax=Hymenoscyphus albidus TaxID=595503 RepID=A0A9N9Q204_9HELO|nr:hypothetical protein HYALB_00007828 [Hymenoscyphus albidus]
MGQTDLLSMFNLHTIDDSKPKYHHGLFTCAATSNPGTSSFEGISELGKVSSSSSSSSSGNVFGISNNTSINRDTTEGGKSGPSTAQTKRNSILGAPIETEAHGLRFFHNVAMPDTFCPNHHTGNRYRACAGSGWLTFPHLKEHTKNRHKAEESSPFKCSGCQAPFENEKSLKAHNDFEDCEIKCSQCPETFDSKASRKSHQDKMHPNGGNSIIYKEIVDAKWNRLNSECKRYLAELKKKGEEGVDPGLREWVARNTNRYRKNRKDPKPFVDLGQWYISFRVLNLNEKIPDHPFYDYYPSGELAIAKITVIFRGLLEAEICEHGFPAQNPEFPGLYVRFFSNVLEKTLRIARNTGIKPDGRSRLAEDTSMDESAPAAAAYGPQNTLLSNTTSNGMGTLLTSTPMLPHQQQHTMQQDATQQDAMQQDAMQQDAMQQDAMQQDAMQQDAMQQDAMQQDAMQQYAMQQYAMQQHAMQLFPGVGNAQHLSAENQAVPGIANMTSGTGPIYDPNMYQAHQLPQLSGSYSFDPNQSNNGFYPPDQPDAPVHEQNWMTRGQHQ